MLLALKQTVGVNEPEEVRFTYLDFITPHSYHMKCKHLTGNVVMISFIAFAES